MDSAPVYFEVNIGHVTMMTLDEGKPVIVTDSSGTQWEATLVDRGCAIGFTKVEKRDAPKD